MPLLTGTSQLKQNAKAHSYICGVCRTAFLCTTSEKMLRDHVAAKHEKSTFEVCLRNMHISALQLAAQSVVLATNMQPW